MRRLCLRLAVWFQEATRRVAVPLPGVVGTTPGAQGDPCAAALRRQAGQTTAEYALVLLAAAAVALVLIAWARSSGRLPAFFDSIIDQITGSAQ